MILRVVFSKHAFFNSLLMEWAPFEFSKDKRTFSTQQVFDFGKTLARNNVNQHFEITIAREQGGAFKRNFMVGQKLGVVLYVTADNYQEENEFCFEIEVPQALPGRLVTPAKIVSVQKFV